MLFRSSRDRVTTIAAAVANAMQELSVASEATLGDGRNVAHQCEERLTAIVSSVEDVEQKMRATETENAAQAAGVKEIDSVVRVAADGNSKVLGNIEGVRGSVQNLKGLAQSLATTVSSVEVAMLGKRQDDAAQAPQKADDASAAEDGETASRAA